MERHYFRPLWIAFSLQIIATLLSPTLRTANPKNNIALLIKMQLFLVFSVFVHFNFKEWMPLVNPNLFDTFYYEIDNDCYSIITLFFSIRRYIINIIPFNMDFAYHHFFVIFFFLSFSLLMLYDSLAHLRQLILSVCLVLLIGGLCYWIAPAEGPFMFREGVNLMSTNSQYWMHSQFSYLLKTGLIAHGYFASPPAAMPSLHIAHTLVFSYFAWRYMKLLLILYAPMAFWLILESVCSAFHYLVDLPAGIL